MPPSAAQADCVAEMQLPLERQQAPAGEGQLAPAQAVPLPR